MVGRSHLSNGHGSTRVGIVDGWNIAHVRTPNPFDALPIEINQQIADRLGSDMDVANAQQSCKSLQLAIEDGHFWRKRFLRFFDRPRPDGPLHKKQPDYEKEYKRRQDVLQRSVHGNFSAATMKNRRQQLCVNVLRDLVLDSFHGKTAHNLSHITKFARRHDLTRILCLFPPLVERGTFFREDQASLLQTIQLLLTPNILQARAPYETGFYPETQYMAYAAAIDRPIFGGFDGMQIDMNWCLQQIQFWRYHMLRGDEYTLFDAYHALSEAEYPRYWSAPLTNDGDAQIGANWRGAYGFVGHDEIEDIRLNNGREELHIMDEFQGDGQCREFQALRLTLTDESEQDFNPLFESILHSLEPPAPTAQPRTRAQKRCASSPLPVNAKSRSFRFGGLGRNSEEAFLADGWLNPLPSQHDIPGWQRMTMMKYFKDDNGDPDTESLWAYEGVCLPGGRIIVGRWWSPSSTLLNSEDMYCGPFLFWCVDDP